VTDDLITRAAAVSLMLSDGELAALLGRAAGGEPLDPDLLGAAAAPWVADGSPVGILADGLAALADPVCTIELRRGDRLAGGALDEVCAAIVVPGADAGEHRLIVVTTPFLPDVLCRLNDVAPRPRVDPALVLRFEASDLTQVLAARDGELAASLAGDEGAAAASQLVATLREHWRVELRWAPAPGSPGQRAVEVLDSDRGLWRVVADGSAVELHPTTPTAVFRLLVELLPDHDELAGAASANGAHAG
jgi:hypothetical protein